MNQLKGTVSSCNLKLTLKNFIYVYSLILCLFSLSFAVSSDFVAVEIKLFVNASVELATREFKFYSCAATVRKSENTPWVRGLICHFFSVTPWKHAVTVNTASAVSADVNASPCMNRWAIKALFVNCNGFGLHFLHFPHLCLLPSWGNCLSFLFINQKNESQSPHFLPLPIFLFISFMPGNFW